MKKNKKKPTKKKAIKTKPIKKKSTKKKAIKTKPIKNKKRKISSASKRSILKIIRFQDKLKPKFNFNFFENTKKFIKGFFQKITDTI